jgi:hypothetical protein
MVEKGRISGKDREHLYDAFAFTVRREQDRAIDGLVIGFRQEGSEGLQHECRLLG